MQIARIIINDKHLNLKYLIDTGEDVSVLPANFAENIHRKPTNKSLFAANGTPIPIYGEKRITVDLGLRRQFTWNFLVADVTRPIIGMDFLRCYGLLIASG